MGRILAIVLLIQISLPGFCCFANRVARSTATLIGFSDSECSLQFWSNSCCVSECCNPNSPERNDCCSCTNRCCSDGADPNAGTEDLKQRDPSNDPARQKICDCLDSDPMVPPSWAQVDLAPAHGFYEPNRNRLLLVNSLQIGTARYHPPPLRRHLFLCVIRC